MPIDLHYERYGSGDPVVFLHGFGASLYSWKLLVPYLQNHYCLYLVDLKGHGTSPAPRDGRYAVKDRAEAVCRLISTQNLRRVVLVGNSYGGAVALLVTLMLRDAGTPPRALVLIDSGAYAAQKLPGYMRVLAMPVLSTIISLIPRRWLIRDAVHKVYYDPRRIPSDIIGSYLIAGKRPEFFYVAQQMVKQLVPPDHAAIEARYASITQPTLILWGRQDHIIPLAVGERLHAAISGSQFIVFENCGHVPQEELPRETAGALVDFLKNLPAND